MQDHVLGIAARYNDAAVEEHGLPKFIADQGLDIEDVFYISEQRGLRTMWAARYGRMPIPTDEFGLVILTQAQRQHLVVYQASVLDGLMIGWRAKALDGA